MNAINLQAENQQLQAQVEQLQEQLSKQPLQSSYEQGLVKQILQHASRRNFSEPSNIKHTHRPVSDFDGDLFLLAKRPDGGSYCLLGDFTGHGLAAAIGGMPVSEIFFSMAAKSMNVGEIAREMNLTLNRLLPDSMFFAACLLEVDGKGDRITLWSGGMNDILWFEKSTQKIKRIASRHMPLGVASAGEFNTDYSRLYCSQGDSLLIYSDGIIEARNDHGEEFGGQLLEGVFASEQERAIEGIMHTFDEFLGENAPNDDITVAQLMCRPSF